MKEFITFQSANKESTIHSVIWLPENAEDQKAKGLLQISHGMNEHIERYDAFAQYMAQRGFIVFGNDHAGHGNSAATEEDFGFFAHENGHAVVIRDLRRLAKMMLSQYPALPYMILGHSMGSFIARIYTSLYGDDLACAIYMGTGSGNPLYQAAMPFLKREIKKKGAKAKATFFEAVSNGAFNRKIPGKRTDADWLSRDEREVDKFISDPKCGHTFTTSAYHDLFKFISIANEKKTTKKIPEGLPILLISGDMDPVGDYGKGVLNVADSLIKTGHTNLTLKMYPEARHELLNEINRDEVMEYLYSYCNQYTEK